MTLQQLVEAVRYLLDDFGGDRGNATWAADDSLCETPNGRLVALLEQARHEYLTRNPIRDASSAVTVVEVPAGGYVALDPRILSVRTVALVDEPPLVACTRADLDGELPDWRSETGTPWRWCGDDPLGWLRLYPAPTTAVEVQLVVDRLALAPLQWSAAATEVAEVPVHHQPALAAWAAARVLEVRGMDTPNAAALITRFDTQFVAAAGAPVGAEVIAQRRYLAAGGGRVRGIGLRGWC